ncbi:MAG: cobalt-precorrin 5A hydrolase [Lachnospiraceae bacterium]|nr:cobalt-precorrin 5A hydrolase [Lachnospiraceae bacterium]
MKLSIISFTKNGMRLSERIAKTVRKEMEVCTYTKCATCIKDDKNLFVISVAASVGEWTKAQMQERNAILFIGACGIAVRAIAPFLTDKLHDVPVLVMDERGNYVIPILSGHVGGANELATRIAEKTGAEAVITTATDINGKFAVDIFAKRNGLLIEDKEGIVKISSKVLAGEEITISMEQGLKVKGRLPEGVHIVSYPPTGFTDIIITSKEQAYDSTIVLRPKEYVLGVGCKKGKDAGEIRQFISGKLKERDILSSQILALASVLQKKEEKGLIEWCRSENIPFLTFPASELQELTGDFVKSVFVKEQVGVDNVCERAALKACGAGGHLILRKCAENGMTIAIAKRDWTVDFDGE